MKILILCLLFINSILKSSEHDNSFLQYKNYNKILDYLLDLNKEHPANVHLKHIGFSREDRPIPLITICSDNCDEPYVYERTKPIILIDACTHGREWITVAVALYLIHQLVEHKENRILLQHFDWYILPIVNPDGYEYSFTTNRYWRKNRAKGVKCDGVDLNRNFNYHWGEKNAGRECSENYPGPWPFSEPESRAFKRLVLQQQDRIKLSVSLHSYGELIAYAWGYKDKPVSEEFEASHHEQGNLVAEKINSIRGAHYKAGRQSSVLYNASGMALDWMVGVANIPMAFIFEISNKSIKFTPPVSEIQPTSKEIFEGLKVLHKFIDT